MEYLLGESVKWKFQPSRHGRAIWKWARRVLWPGRQQRKEHIRTLYLDQLSGISPLGTSILRGWRQNLGDELDMDTLPAEKWFRQNGYRCEVNLREWNVVWKACASQGATDPGRHGTGLSGWFSEERAMTETHATPSLRTRVVCAVT